MTDSHLTPKKSNRGFTHLAPIPVWSGYELVGDFEALLPREVGEISAYESSDAVIPSIWVRVRVFNQRWANDLRTYDEAVMMTVDNARKLGEQLIYLADAKTDDDPDER